MSELSPGTAINYRFTHWPGNKPTQTGRIVEKVPVHCQLHGEFQGYNYRVQRTKPNGQIRQCLIPVSFEGMEVEVVGHE